ncbi:efflux transporter outer membrane subunit [Azohydromonas caseinilytica]|uniref:Efflux transporter outer membrane subunit n=1 Tax=Azohydromonas caseinilytica TaxID=2728836 RepID=A0A848F9L3_9BURK|nr:efflux transporter outer membrane subunit [Azohydromonas caseinilytica]NML15149.1 efflux transporter outer membrane subunit [Azohydromonas caseinilytica]
MLRLPLSLCVALLSGCAALSPPPPAPPAPTAWQAPRPHDGEPQALAQWWSRFDDPLLASLVAQAQASSPTLAQAAARIAQARAQLTVAGAALSPTLDGRADASRISNAFPPPTLTYSIARVGADAGWEIDLFGGRRAGVAVAQAQAGAAAAQWHDARVSLAAEVGLSYVGLRACEAQVALDAQNVAAARQIAELTQRKVEVGFESPANGALAQATLSDTLARAQAQQAECEVAVKALVALTGLDEPALRAQLGARAAQLPRPAAFGVAAVPAQVLAQRPDLAAAEQQLRAAAAGVDAAEAARWPRLLLAGAITLGVGRVAGVQDTGANWSFGPALSLPLFDAGRRRAEVDAARARLDEALAAWEQRARGAVREVEEALVRLDAAARREDDARTAAENWQRFVQATQTRWELGNASLIELQDARRQRIAAEAALLVVQRERVNAWVQLYKASGGGWDGSLAVADAANSLNASGARANESK